MKTFEIKYSWKHRHEARGGSSYTIRASTHAEALDAAKAAFGRDFGPGYEARFEEEGAYERLGTSREQK